MNPNPLATPAERSGARRGADVLARLRDRPPAIWYRGERVNDVTTHPAFSGGVASLAELYDLQWQHATDCLFESPASGRQVARSFQLPKTLAELAGISRAMEHWARYTHGMMGRVPDYLNRAMSAYAAGAPFLAAADPRFGLNAVRLHEELREADLCLTHSLIPPQANRSVGPAQQADEFLAARIKAETDSGFVVRGCRMLATLPIADAIMVLPSTLLKATPDDAPYAFGFVISTDTPGLKLICRESVDYGRSRFDHPLSSRFEEMDAVVVFDDVRVPWDERAAVSRRRALQYGVCAYRRRRRHGAPGRHQEHRKIRVRVGSCRAAGRHDRGRTLPARPGEARGALGHARDDARAQARGRGRCRARRVGRHAPGVEPARRRTQPVPEVVSADDRDPAADSARAVSSRCPRSKT